MSLNDMEIDFLTVVQAEIVWHIFFYPAIYKRSMLFKIEKWTGIKMKTGLIVYNWE